MAKFFQIAYKEVPKDALSMHTFNCEQIQNLAKLQQQIETFRQTQGKGAEFPTQAEMELEQALAENRILWPIVREDVINLNILTPNAIDLFDQQEEFKMFKDLPTAKHFLERQLTSTKNFLIGYDGEIEAYKALQKQLNIEVVPARKR